MLKKLAARPMSLVLVAIVTVLFLIPGLPQAALAVTVSSNMEGVLVKADLPDVYFVGSDNKRYVFPNEKVFFSWYNDFSTVRTITGAELAAFAIGGNVTYRPGTRLVKIQTDPKVYAVAADGTLRWIPTEQLAQQLYGGDWSKRVDDVPDSYFTNYHQGADISSTSDYDPTNEQRQASDISTDKKIATGPTEPNANPADAVPNSDTGSNSTSAYRFCLTDDNITEGCCANSGSSFAQAGASVAAGSLIKSAASPMVYYYASNGKRYVMTGKDVIASWYNQGQDLLTGASSACRNVKQLSASDLSAIPLGGNVDIRPGTYVLKIASDPKLYVVSRGRTLRPLAESGLAEQIFTGTSTQRLRTIPDAFFGGYKMGATITTPADYSATAEYDWSSPNTMERELGI